MRCCKAMPLPPEKTTRQSLPLSQLEIIFLGERSVRHSETLAGNPADHVAFRWNWCGSHERADAPAAAEEFWRRGGAFHMSILRGGMRAAHFSQARQIDFDRRRPGFSHLARTAVS